MQTGIPTLHTVWKYPLNSSGWVIMPRGAKPLYVDVQDGQPFVWAEVWPTDALVKRHLPVYGTGHRIDGWPTYVGTFQLDGLVFHVFSTNFEIELENDADVSSIS